MEFNQLIALPLYEASPVEKEINQMFECLYDYGGVANLFDDFVTALGRPPSQQEYIEAGAGMAKEFFINQPTQYIYKIKSLYTFHWDEKLEKAVKYRLGRTYTSYLLEEQVKSYLLKRGYTIYHNPLLDLNMGVDLVLQHQDRLYYIHVAKNSPSSKRMIKEKGSRRSYKKVDNQKIYYTRNWQAGHSLLLYNTNDTDRMQYINGNLLFNERYLDVYFDKLLQSDDYDVLDGQSELEQFNQFATQCKQPITIIKEND